MSEKKRPKASAEQWERFTRDWAKEIKGRPHGDLIKSQEYDIDIEMKVVRPLTEEDILKYVSTTSKIQSAADDIQFLQDMRLTINEVLRETQVDLVIRQTGLCFDFLLPPSRASDAHLALEDAYYRVWLPKHGSKMARLIFAVQGAGIIWSSHGRRLTTWLAGVLGLAKLYGWLSGPRGG
jgi:hypothetical protein